MGATHLSKTEKKQRYYLKCFKRELKNRRRFKLYRKIKNRSEVGLAAHERAFNRSMLRRNMTVVTPPTLFSFVKNPEQVARFMATMRRYCEDRTKVYVDLSDVTDIDYDAVVVLLSVMMDFKGKRIPFNGSYPANAEVKKALIESRFFKVLYSDKLNGNEDDGFFLQGQNFIVTHGKRTADPQMAGQIVRGASETVWGAVHKCALVYGTLIELMHNTNNHATPNRRGDKLWWLSVKHIKAEHRVTFSFVDYGVGIFKSLENKPKSDEKADLLKVIKESLLSALGVTPTNADCLRKIFEGTTPQSVTGKYYRGKGLPLIYQAIQEKRLSKLVIITNDVYYDSSTENYRTLRNSFQGTFVYWELNVDDRYHPTENDQSGNGL